MSPCPREESTFLPCRLTSPLQPVLPCLQLALLPSYLPPPPPVQPFLQLPEVIEQAALRLVHLCGEPEQGLAARLSSALGAVMPPMLAGPWLRR